MIDLKGGLYAGQGRALGVIAVALATTGAAVFGGCGVNTTLFGAGGGTGVTTSGSVSVSGVTSSGPGASTGTGGHTTVIPTKIDLLLVVDNSRSMADKQQLLALVTPDLIAGLVNPACLDATGKAVPAAQQPSAIGACPPGAHRDFAPVPDVHVGLLSSSLGSFGADSCPDVAQGLCASGASTTSNNDHGHLVTRADPCAPSDVLTYQGKGFLAWDPAMKLTPPGESQLGDVNTPGIVKSLHDLVLGDGQLGCGFESQNEAWYRFLVDPAPYGSISLVNNAVQKLGTDAVLLQERSDFLRPDSLVAIVELTDETDTSIKQFSQFPLFAQLTLNGQTFHLPRARQDCTAKGPNDPCCASCGQPTPSGCAIDPICASNPTYTSADDNVSLHAFGLISHKQRYGIEFFYQPSRYVKALTSATIIDDLGTSHPNPLFAGGRSPNLVFYAAIVGVPWQLIARQNAGVPDLVNGVSALDPNVRGGFKTAKELDLKDAHGNTFWDDIAGDPEKYVPAKSPFMQESTVPRGGSDPITGLAISPPGSPNGANPINGHEYNIGMPAGDIEYACVFPILKPIDCSKGAASCDCSPSLSSQNPLCEPNPNDNGNPTLQVRAKAYPGIKHLAIAKGLGDQGIVASICAKQLTDAAAPDFGYRPAAKAILDRLGRAIRGH